MKQLFLLLSVFLMVNISITHAQKVFVTKSGDKFHTKDCQYAKKDVTEMSLADAKAKNMKSCSVCNADKKIFITKSGDKYHTKDCQHAKGATESTLAEAKEKGLKACTVCNPDGGKTDAAKDKKETKKK